jgi:hypothetical protein
MANSALKVLLVGHLSAAKHTDFRKGFQEIRLYYKAIKMAFRGFLLMIFFINIATHFSIKRREPL